MSRAPRESRRAPVPLRLSAASNGLQFSHHFNGRYQPRGPPPMLQPPQYYSDSPSYTHVEARRPAKKLQTNILTPIDPNKNTSSGSKTPPNEIPSPVLRRTVSSLLLPVGPSKPRSKRSSSTAPPAKTATKPTGSKLLITPSLSRLSSSAASIHSTTSSFRSRKRKYYQVACLTSLPCEILDEVFKHLNQKELHAVLLCNKYLADSAAPALYANPRFASTYRFAQFVSLITHNPPLAQLVRELDLSGVAEGIPEDEAVAGWREWKYRNAPLHTIRREDKHHSRKGSGAGGGGGHGNGGRATGHPLPSPFLTQYHTCRDIPIGAVIHIVVACENLRRIDISNVPLAADYVVLPPAGKFSGYRPTAFTNLLFVSDVPKSYTWRSEETKVVNAAVDLVNAVTRLRYLHCFEVRHGVWVTHDIASKLVRGCLKAEYFDFRECGMYKGTRWAMEGTKKEIGALLDASDRKSPEVPDAGHH